MINECKIHKMKLIKIGEEKDYNIYSCPYIKCKYHVKIEEDKN
jgi:hypothetical protein